MGTHLHGDGLFQKYGTDKATANVAGEFRTVGRLREIEMKINLVALTEAETPVSDVTFFPKMRVEEVEVVAETGATTGVAIDLGLVRTDRTTQIDFDGFLAAAPTADYNLAGEKIIYRIGVTGVGALVGTTTTLPGYITCSRTTATAFTTGVLRITIRYYAV